MEQLNSLPIECKKILLIWVFSQKKKFLSTEVGELAKKYQVWHKQMAEQNPSVSRSVSMITKGSARIHLTQMRKETHPKERKMRKLQRCSRSNATRGTWGDAQET
jgi:hypothetical protein